jgi:hypothetical protein
MNIEQITTKNCPWCNKIILLHTDENNNLRLNHHSSNIGVCIGSYATIYEVDRVNKQNNKVKKRN